MTRALGPLLRTEGDLIQVRQPLTIGEQGQYDGGWAYFCDYYPITGADLNGRPAR